VPPIPADTVVLFGAFLSAQGRASAWVVWLVTWLPNVASAVTVYYLSRRYGRRFFETRVGRLLLHPRQLERVHAFYDRWGALAIFFSRFLPGFRAVVPLFAGTAHLGLVRAGVPMLAASGIWYGLLVMLGHEAGVNWEALQAIFADYSAWLVWIAGGLAIALVVWWVGTRSRHARP
jgi:membrane protein DedA with SNARE-associated domain